MDDPVEELPELQNNQEPLQVTTESLQILGSDQEGQSLMKNPSSLKIRFRFLTTPNGVCREEKEEETHVQKKVQIPVELKRQLSTSSMEEQKDHTEGKSEGMMVCQVCGKFFPSSKSLSGHMRLHPERQWRGITPPSNSDSSMVKIDNDRKPSSPKVNSLFGHMRRHPDRPWTGIKPPHISDSVMIKNEYEQHSSPTSRTSEYEPFPLYKSWSKRGKRGQKSEEQREGDKPEAADALLMLPNGNSLDLANEEYILRTRVIEGSLMLENIEDNVEVLESSELPMKRRMEGLETENPVFQCKKAKIDRENENGLIPKLVKMDPRSEIPNEVENSYAVRRIPSNCMPLKSEIMMKKCELGKMDCSDETPMSSNRFICNICNKSFSSYQALGGHKSGHKNDKNGIHNADVEKLSSVTQVDESQEFIPSILKHNGGTHQCKICNKTFPSGQALGGHQRLHRPVLTVAPISSGSTSEQFNKGSPTCSVSLPEKMFMESPISSVSSPEKIILKEQSISSVTLLEEVSSKTDHNPMGFDLNELPPLDYECFN